MNVSVHYVRDHVLHTHMLEEFKHSAVTEIQSYCTQFALANWMKMGKPTVSRRVSTPLTIKILKKTNTSPPKRLYIFCIKRVVITFMLPIPFLQNRSLK